MNANDDNGAGTVFVAGGGVIDGTGSGLRPGAGLLVRDGRVVIVDDAARMPSAGNTVDVGDGVIVPGFVDAHTHVTIRPGEGDQHGQLRQPPAWQAVRGVDNLGRMLRSGVTTARIMTEDHDIDFLFRAALDSGEICGPRLRVAGKGLSPPGGHGSGGAGVSGVTELRAAVRDRVGRGADHIKVFMTGGVSSTDSTLDQSNYSAEEIAAIVDEATAAGLMVSAHAHGGPGVDFGVTAGIRSVEHGALLSQGNVDLMAEHGTWMVLTNSILFHPAGIEQGDARSPAIMDKVTHARVAAAESARLIREKDIPIALGTDSMHGLFGFEMRWMVEHGWTASEALTAATRGGAGLLGLDDIGTLESGKRADFAVLARDPLADITAVDEVVAVYQDGRQTVDSRGFCRPSPSDAGGTR